jgi:hypothetical protein
MGPGALVLLDLVRHNPRPSFFHMKRRFEKFPIFTPGSTSPLLLASLLSWTLFHTKRRFAALFYDL